MVTQIIFRLISPLRIQLSGEVDAAFLRLSALEDAAQRNLLAVASIRIILLPTAAKAPAVEASTGAAARIAVLAVPAVGNAAGLVAATGAKATRPKLPRRSWVAAPYWGAPTTFADHPLLVVS